MLIRKAEAAVSFPRLLADSGEIEPAFSTPDRSHIESQNSTENR